MRWPVHMLQVIDFARITGGPVQAEQRTLAPTEPGSRYAKRKATSSATWVTTATRLPAKTALRDSSARAKDFPPPVGQTSNPARPPSQRYFHAASMPSDWYGRNATPPARGSETKEAGRNPCHGI